MKKGKNKYEENKRLNRDFKLIILELLILFYILENVFKRLIKEKKILNNIMNIFGNDILNNRII